MLEPSFADLRFVRLWNLYTGRHNAINDSDITAPRPTQGSKASQQALWTNIGDPWETNSVQLLSPTPVIDDALIDLCEMMGLITRTL